MLPPAPVHVWSIRRWIRGPCALDPSPASIQIFNRLAIREMRQLLCAPNFQTGALLAEGFCLPGGERSTKMQAIAYVWRYLCAMPNAWWVRKAYCDFRPTPLPLRISAPPILFSL